MPAKDFPDHGKRQIFPGNLMFLEQQGLETLVPCSKFFILQPTPKYQIDLAYMGNAVEGIGFEKFDGCPGLLVELPFCTRFHRLALFKKPRRNRPLAVPGLDGTPAQ